MGNIVPTYCNLFLHIWVLLVKCVILLFFFSSRREEAADIPCWPEGKVGEALRPLLLKYIKGKQQVALLEG